MEHEAVQNRRILSVCGNLGKKHGNSFLVPRERISWRAFYDNL